MTALCSDCARHLNLASPPSCSFDCNLSWQLRARGWFQSKRGKWYCPDCSSGYLDQPDIHRKYQKHLCEWCMEKSGQNYYHAQRRRQLESFKARPEACVYVGCFACRSFCNLPCRQCNLTWQLRARGWYKSRRGNWYCPVCASGYATDPPESVRTYSKHVCEICTENSGQVQWQAACAWISMGGSSSSTWRFGSV